MTTCPWNSKTSIMLLSNTTPSQVSSVLIPKFSVTPPMYTVPFCIAGMCSVAPSQGQ